MWIINKNIILIQGIVVAIMVSTQIAQAEVKSYEVLPDYAVSPAKIIKIFDKDSNAILSKRAEEISLTKAGFAEAAKIAAQLTETLIPLMPAAGLAAPQIGISKRVFIYSWDRSPANLEVAINPRIIESSSDTTTSWEACFSTIQESGTSQAALVTRLNSIIVEYINLKGKTIKRKLVGFAAKVFQHEYDHLDGIENVKKENAEIKTFQSEVELGEFMRNVKKTDSVSYIKPVELE